MMGFISQTQAQSWSLEGDNIGTLTPPFTSTLKLGTLDNLDLPFYTNNNQRLTLKKTGWLGLGITEPRGWQEILYCPPPNQSETGLIVTLNKCTQPFDQDWTVEDVIGGGLIPGPGGSTGGEGAPVVFTIPFSFLTGNTTNVLNPFLTANKEPLFWARVQEPPLMGTGLDKFKTKFIVMPDGSCGINVAHPRAALDVLGSQGFNRPAAIFGSRAMGTHVLVGSNMQFFTQQVHFVPRLNENGYNQIVHLNDQGMFFSDGKGAEGANLGSAFVLAPWAAASNAAVGGMRMDANGNTEFHGTLRATKVNIDAVWWSDFVFADDYKLPSLAEVEKYITAYKHLPNVPSEKEVLENGLDVANMQAIQQQKIEELTLYIIKMQKQMDAMQKQMVLLKQ